MRHVLLAALMLLFVTDPTAAAFAAPAPVAGAACNGQYAAIRTSSVLPGKMSLFQKAVADQSGWYASHHDGTTVKLLRVYAKGSKDFSDSEAMTITAHPKAIDPEHDQAWDAFVAEFKASSKITSETHVCLPN